MAFDLLHPTRENIHKLYAAHASELRNIIPEGLNNNLVWNAGHVVATMELLTYGLSGLKTPSGKEFIDRYRKGSRPDGPVSAEEQAYIADRLRSGVTQLEADLKSLDFSNFREYTTSYGVTLSNIDDALAFNNLHEAMHLGTMLAIRNLLK
jgi:hypothetical protein